jgi:hypothetical protein
LKIADVQILFYAIDRTADLHAVAVRWLEDAINAREPMGLAWPTIHQFLRLGTNRAYPGAMSEDEALDWVSDWVDAGVALVPDSETTWALFHELVTASPRTLRNSIDDAHLAAIAISRGATLVSFDSDFAVFADHGLRWEHLRAP